MFWATQTTLIYLSILRASNKQPPVMMMMMMMRMNNNNNNIIIMMSRISTLRSNRRPLMLLNYVAVTERNCRRLLRQKRYFSSSSVVRNDYVSSSSSSSIIERSRIASASSSSSSSSSVNDFWHLRYCHDYDNIDNNDSKPISTSQNKLVLSSSSKDRCKTTDDTTTTSTSTSTATVKTKDRSESNNNNENQNQNQKMDDNGENDDTPPPPTPPTPPPTTTKMMIFPWRHHPTLLNRCQPGTTENLNDSHLLTSSSVSPESPTLHAITTAYFFLDVPWYQFIFWSNWKDDIADSISFAFTQGVACLLSNLSQDPLESIVKDTYEINFHKIVESYNKSDDEGKLIIDNKDQISLEPMMETKLISLYSKARDDLNSRLLAQQKTGEGDATTTKIEICLKMVPVSAELYSLYSIPYISRNNIRSDKKLLEFYKQMIDKPSSERAPDLFQLRTTHLETGFMESTVICQILIWCNELFYVKDVTSDKVLQGHMDTKGQNVPHLIRMEKIVRTEKKPNGSFHNQQGDWIITDIDDLLGGNLIV